MISEIIEKIYGEEVTTGFLQIFYKRLNGQQKAAADFKIIEQIREQQKLNETVTIIILDILDGETWCQDEHVKKEQAEKLEKQARELFSKEAVQVVHIDGWTDGTSSFPCCIICKY
jgi:LAS superfamily LD-carboxypeptidase LdcB